jgi:predicted rRNA methylase YqxC with S4 and FtsJ domains
MPWMWAVGQLAWKLRRDPRVVVMEQTNARSLTRLDFPRTSRGRT